MHDRTHAGNSFCILNAIDEYTRECLAVWIAREITHQYVREVLTDLFCERDLPFQVYSDNG